MTGSPTITPSRKQSGFRECPVLAANKLVNMLYMLPGPQLASVSGRDVWRDVWRDMRPLCPGWHPPSHSCRAGWKPTQEREEGGGQASPSFAPEITLSGPTGTDCDSAYSPPAGEPPPPGFQWSTLSDVLCCDPIAPGRNLKGLLAAHRPPATAGPREAPAWHGAPSSGEPRRGNQKALPGLVRSRPTPPAGLPHPPCYPSPWGQWPPARRQPHGASPSPRPGAPPHFQVTSRSDCAAGSRPPARIPVFLQSAGPLEPFLPDVSCSPPACSCSGSAQHQGSHGCVDEAPMALS